MAVSLIDSFAGFASQRPDLRVVTTDPVTVPVDAALWLDDESAA
jgi:hypothetical protein